MKRISRGKIYIVSAVIILALALCFFFTRMYNPRDISSGIITRGEKEYHISDNDLNKILGNLRYSFMFRDSVYCGFEEVYKITFYNTDKQEVSKLYIALDGCPTFRVDGTEYYLEGRKEAREVINEIVYAESN